MREDLSRKKIGVLLGGLSSEREVSLKTGGAVLGALLDRGFDAVRLDAGPDLAAGLRAEGIEVVFNALHGRFGEDGTVQGLLEVMGIPYTGSGVLASALGMDKVMSKKVFAFHGIPLAPYRVVTEPEAAGALPSWFPFGFPVVVKPARQGSSIGVSLVETWDGLAPALRQALVYDTEAIVEAYVRGREVQVAILGTRALGAIEIVPHRAFYDYQAKYEGASEHVYPARLSPETTRIVHDLALAAHRALDCRVYSRVDLIVDADGRPFVLEVNTLPGMTDRSLFPEIARGAGISFGELVEAILLLSVLPREAQEAREARTTIGGEDAVESILRAARGKTGR
ncbi:MAG: hypothetical protein A2V83_08510 [Nitrospirae bacterium RBG_16_64_22]|nr:MAG: hypothetical protein A2V83_08510 [Nitrospirae bacterium RBG_16_64_22]